MKTPNIIHEKTCELLNSQAQYFLLKTVNLIYDGTIIYFLPIPKVIPAFKLLRPV